MGVDVLAVGTVGKSNGLVGGSTAGDGRDDVKTAGLEVLELGIGNDLLVDDLLDVRNSALVVALEVGVQLQNSLGGGGVKALHAVGAGVGERSVGFLGGQGEVILDLGSLDKAVAVLGIEVAGDVDAVAVVSKIGAFAQVELDGRSGESAVGDVVEVRQLISGDGDSEGVVVDQTQAGELGSAGAFGAVIFLVSILPAENGTAVGLHAGSLGPDRSQAGSGGDQVVLGGDSGAVGELHVIEDGDGDGLVAVSIFLFAVLLHNGGVPDVAAFLGGGDGLKANGQALNVVVGGAGAGLAERGVTELAGELGGAAQDDAVVFLLRGPVDQSAGRAPERVGGVLFNALDLSIVEVVVLIGVQGNLRQEHVPTGDVQTPPGGVHVVGRSIITSGLIFVHHGHGQEVQAELVLLAVDLDVGQAGVRILDYVSDGVIDAVFLHVLVKALIVLTVLQGIELHRVVFGGLNSGDSFLCRFLGSGLFCSRGLSGGLFRSRGFRSRGFGGLGLAAGSQGEDHAQSQKQCENLFHCFSSY